MTQLFASGGQSIGGSASAEPVSIKGWFPESKEIEIKKKKNNKGTK